MIIGRRAHLPMFNFLCKRSAVARTKRHSQDNGQTFILESILTPSALLEIGEETPDLDAVELPIEQLDDLNLPETEASIPNIPLPQTVPEAELDELSFITLDNTTSAIDLSEIDFSDLDRSAGTTTTSFQSGVFTVGDFGQISVDFLFDGGAYKGELAIFSLEDLGEFDFSDTESTHDFIQIAAERALSDSEWGHILIADRTEGAKFSGLLGEQQDWNYGEYQGPKVFELNAGEDYGLMLVPNGRVKDVWGNPAIGGSRQPLFSMGTADPDDIFTSLQMVDLTGEGTKFTFEDLPVGGQSDLDYNDLIFQLKGATSELPSIEDAIGPEIEWIGDELVTEIIGYDSNVAPDSLQLGGEAFYTANEDIQVLGRVYDLDGFDDIARIDVQIRLEGGDWTDITPDDVTQFQIDAAGWATFNYSVVDDLDPGHYQLQTIAYDRAGAASDPVDHNFVVLSLPDSLPDSVKAAIERAIDLDSYDPETLAETTQWIVSVQTGHSPQALAAQVDADNLGSTFHIPNTYIWEFDPGSDPAVVAETLASLSAVEYAYPLVEIPWETQFAPNDSLFDDQWHLEKAHLPAAWDQSIVDAGQNLFRESSVVIGIVDDGIQHTHPDLQPNYRADLSRNFHEKEDGIYGSDPSPDSDNDDDNARSHGTSVAGVAAARGHNNETGIAGTAPTADIAGLRLPEDRSPDIVVADALSYLRNDIDIYNNSWKPNWYTPNSWEANLGNQVGQSIFALSAGANQGRDGLGNIYVFSGGNDGSRIGGLLQGNVNYNPLANSRYTIAVAAIDRHGVQATRSDQKIYSEPGAPLLVSAYSKGFSNGVEANAGIYTTNYLEADADPPDSDAGLPNGYTRNFGGTSPAAAMVSGVVALMLEANPTLTWRDVQHILVDTADRNDQDDDDWKKNGADYWVNHKYGFGAVNADNAVKEAATWKTVNPEVLITSGEKPVNQSISDGNTVEIPFEFTTDITLESLEVKVDIEHARRGDLDIVLVSPDGTESVLAANHQDLGDNYSNWLFTSMRHWGESSQGIWKLKITDKGENDMGGFWKAAKVNLYGTKPTVTLNVVDRDAKEGDNGAEFTVSRTGNTKHALDVFYTIDGSTAAVTADYSATGLDPSIQTGRIKIPVGKETASILITPADDSAAELTEYVYLALRENSAYEVGDAKRNFFYLWDNETPQIQVGLHDHRFNYASESGNEGYFRFRRLGDLAPELNVNYVIGGTAVLDTDYHAENLSGTAYFFPGQQEVGRTPTIVPIDDAVVDDGETVEVTVTAGAGYNIHSTAHTAILTIDDNDNKPTVKLEAIDSTASEFGDPGQFVISRTGDTMAPLTVNFSTLGAVKGVDYDLVSNGNPIGNSVTIPVGSENVTLELQPIDDNLAEPLETAYLRLARDSTYALSADPYEQSSVTIADNDAPKIEWLQQDGSAGYDRAHSIATDGQGNVYIAGSTSGDWDDLPGNNQGLHDAFWAKYDSDGNPVSGHQFGGSGHDTATSIAVDSDGTIYVLGLTDSFGSGRQDGFLAKYNSAGNPVWVSPLLLEDLPHFADAGYDVTAGKIAIDQDGIYLTGMAKGDLDTAAGENQHYGETDVFVARLDKGDGTLLGLGQFGTSAWDAVQDIAIDDVGDIYLAGYTRGDLSGTHQGETDVFVAKLKRSDLSVQWKQQLGTTAKDEAQSIAVDEHGSVYISGYTQGWLPGSTLGSNAGDADAFLARFNSDTGQRLWTQQLGTSTYDSATGVAVDQSGSIYVSGRTYSDLAGSHQGNADGWVIRYDSAGHRNLHWQLQPGTLAEDSVNDIAANSSGVYLAGITGGSFGDYDSDYDVANQGGEDVWLTRIA